MIWIPFIGTMALSLWAMWRVKSVYKQYNQGVVRSGITGGSDIPASYHNGACGFSFADGHSEIKKWKSANSRYEKVQYSYPAQMTFDAAGKDDFAWCKERTGMVQVSDGKALWRY